MSTLGIESQLYFQSRVSMMTIRSLAQHPGPVLVNGSVQTLASHRGHDPVREGETVASRKGLVNQGIWDGLDARRKMAAGWRLCDRASGKSLLSESCSDEQK